MSSAADQMESLADRSADALTQCMSVLPTDDSEQFDVVSESGSTYRVDLRVESCECPDAIHRRPDGGCKHVRRAEYATGRKPIPCWVDLDGVDDQLGIHVAGQPRRATVDGSTEVI